MHYLALASDYDGTLAKDGQVNQRTIDALKRAKNSGRKLLLVTGRLLEDLRHVFPRLDLFDLVIAENGALIARIDHQAQVTERLLGKPPEAQFLQALRDRNIPFSTGRIIVATLHPHEIQVAEVIKDLGLKREIIMNKGAAMILPQGVNKGSALLEAIHDLQLDPQQVVGLGDAENDLAFLNVCGLSVAMANALPALKEAVDYTTQGSRGDGAVEIIEMLLANDLAHLTT